MSGLVPAIPIQLDKERHLRLDLNAIIEIERETGDTIDRAFEMFMPVPELPKGASKDKQDERAKSVRERRRHLIEYCRLFLWAMLLHEDPALTLKQVGAMLDLSNLASLQSQVVQGINAAMPDSEPAASGAGDGEPKNDGTRSTGPVSGPSGGTT
jgi:hypothetical protein